MGNNNVDQQECNLFFLWKFLRHLNVVFLLRCWEQWNSCQFFPGGISWWRLQYVSIGRTVVDRSADTFAFPYAINRISIFGQLFLRCWQNWTLLVKALANCSDLFVVMVPFLLVFKQFEASHADICFIHKNDNSSAYFLDAVRHWAWKGCRIMLHKRSRYGPCALWAFFLFFNIHRH